MERKKDQLVPKITAATKIPLVFIQTLHRLLIIDSWSNHISQSRFKNEKKKLKHI